MVTSSTNQPTLLALYKCIGHSLSKDNKSQQNHYVRLFYAKFLQPCVPVHRNAHGKNICDVFKVVGSLSSRYITTINVLFFLSKIVGIVN